MDRMLLNMGDLLNPPDVTDVKTFLEHNWILDFPIPVHFDFASNPEGNCCLNDGEPWNGPVFTLPVKYDPVTKTFTVRYTFCSLSCVFRYILDTKCTVKIRTIFALMCRKVYDTDKVTPAPPRARLNKYMGGDLSIEAYRLAGEHHIRHLLSSPSELPFLFDRQKIISTFSQYSSQYHVIEEILAFVHKQEEEENVDTEMEDRVAEVIPVIHEEPSRQRSLVDFFETEMKA